MSDEKSVLVLGVWHRVSGDHISHEKVRELWLEVRPDGPVPSVFEYNSRGAIGVLQKGQEVYLTDEMSFDVWS